MMDLRQTRNTSLLEVRVFDGDGAVAAEIANKIVDVYRRQIEVARLPTKVEVVDPAAPGLRPVRPNVGLILVLGGVFSVLIAAIAALFIRYMISSKGSGRAAL